MSTDMDTRMQVGFAAHELVCRVFGAIDAQDYALAGSLFLADGRCFRRGVWLDGPAAVTAALATRPASEASLHVVSNLVAEPDGRFRCVLAVYRAERPAQGPAPLHGAAALAGCRGVVEQNGAAWRFRELVVEAPGFVRAG